MRAYLEAMEKALYLGAQPKEDGADRARRRCARRCSRSRREKARGAHPYFVPPGAHGARARDPRPRAAGCAPSRWCCSRRDAVEGARDRARSNMQIYTALPNYQNNLRELGFADADFADGGSDRLVDAIVAWGDEKAIAARIQAHHDAGADHVCIQPFRPDGQPGPDLRVLEALAPRAELTAVAARRSFWGWGLEGAGPERGAGARHRPHARRALRRSPTCAWRRRRGSSSIALPAPRVAAPAALAELLLEHALRPRLAHLRQVLPRHRARRARRVPASARLVAFPRSEADVVALLDWCASARLAAIPYGGGSSVVGGVEARDLGDAARRRLDRPRQARPRARDRRASRARRASRRASSAPPSRTSCGPTASRCATSRSPSSSRAWAAGSSPAPAVTTRRCYTHIDEFVEALRVVTPTGIVETRRLPGSGAGPSPDRLWIGSEGTLGIIIEAWMRLQQRPRFRASASVRFAGAQGFLRGAAAVRALSQSGLHPANCRLLDPLEAANSGAGGGDAAMLVLGFESADHALDASMARALELCRDGGGESPEGGGAHAQRRRGRARGRGRRLAQRLPERSLPARRAGARRGDLRDLRDGDHLGPLREIPRGRDAGDARRRRPRVRERQRGLPLHARLSRRPGALLHRARRPAAAAARSSSGPRSRRPPARRCSPPAAPSPTTTPSGATTGPGTTASGRTRFARALRAAKRELDPAGVLNPGVLFD